MAQAWHQPRRDPRPLTPTLTCVLDVAHDRHFNLKILAGRVLHVHDVVGMKDLAQQGVGGGHGTVGATELSPEPHRRAPPWAKGFEAFSPFSSPSQTSPGMRTGPGVGLDGETEWGVGAWPGGEHCTGCTEDAGMESSGKASDRGLKEENERVTWDKQQGKHIRGQETCVDGWIWPAGEVGRAGVKAEELLGS